MKTQHVEYVGQIVAMLCEYFGIRRLKCATYFFFLSPIHTFFEEVLKSLLKPVNIQVNR